jgi:hypothetical protein
MFAALNAFQTGGGGSRIIDVFSTTLYTGNGSSQTITNDIDLSTNGGLVWCKNRDSASNHWLSDTERGINQYLQTQNTDASATLANSFTAFNSNGFSIGSNGPNDPTKNYVSWTFRQAPKFFDVVTWTGNSSTQNIAHGLGSTPGCIFVKCTSSATDWIVWHTSLSSGYRLVLNSTAAQTNSFPSNYFGDNSTVVAPTSTQFTIGNAGDLNNSGTTYVAYLFAHNAGGFGGYGSDNVISCGSTNGSKVTLGYQPQWILYKSKDFSEYWQIVDSQRGMPVGSPAQLLKPNTTDAETTTSNNITVESDGFTLGAVTGTVIYVAIKAS